MGAISNIEWTDASWTPLRARNLKTGKIGWHCEHATSGCEFCYAESMNLRLGTGLPFKPGHRADIELFLDNDTLMAPLRWKKPRKIFVCSMTDLFADFVKDEWIDRLFAVMALCPQHTFQVLTKRAERMRDYLAAWPMNGDKPDRITELARDIAWSVKRGHQGNCGLCERALPNVWLGVSCESQQEADERIPLLLQAPAAIRFVSAEPLLGPTDLSKFMWPVCGWWRGQHRSYDEAKAAGAECGLRRQALVHADCRFIDWVIVGGESGHNARPMHPQWARDIQKQCEAAGVAIFFKQWGEWWPAAQAQPAEFHGTKDEDDRLVRVGKKAAGRLLDGREWNEFPQVRT